MIKAGDESEIYYEKASVYCGEGPDIEDQVDGFAASRTGRLVRR